MNLLSFSDFKASVLRTLERFALPFILAFLVMVMMIMANHVDFEFYYDWEVVSARQDFFNAFAMTGVFLFPIALGLNILMESKGAKNWVRLLVNLLTAGLYPIFYFWYFRDFTNWNDTTMMQFMLLMLAATIFVYFAPLFKKERINAFWQYALKLIVRAIATFIYFMVLFVGIVLLIFSIDYLFELELNDRWIFDTWLIIFGLLGSMFFLSGVPENYDALEKEKDYPKPLKFLVNYIFVPLVFAYVAMLYVYAGKIILTWNWPKGGVAGWIIGFEMAGILTYFLSYSVKEKFHSYVDLFRRHAFFAFFPLLIVLFIAVGFRIFNYGVTEPRYFGVLFGIWILLLCGYFIFSKRKDLKFLPITLFVFLMVAAVGPLSAFSISRNSQMDRLEALLMEDDLLLENGKFGKYEEDKTYRHLMEIDDLIYHIAYNYGTTPFAKWMPDNFEPKKSSNWEETLAIRAELNLPKGNDMGYERYSTYANVYFTGWNDGCGDCVRSVDGYKYFANFNLWQSSKLLKLEEKYVLLEVTGSEFIIEIDSEAKIEFNFAELFEEYMPEIDHDYKAVPLPDEIKTLSFDQFGLKGELRIESMSVTFSDDGFYEITDLAGYIVFD